METLIQFLIWVLLFCIVAYGLYWVCTSFSLPQPVMWICGAILLIILLLFASGMAGVSMPHFPALRR